MPLAHALPEQIVIYRDRVDRECEEIQHKASLAQEEASRREQEAVAAEERAAQLQQVRRCTLQLAGGTAAPLVEMHVRIVS